MICRNTNQREREVVEGITRLTELVWGFALPLNILGETAKDDPDMLGLRYEVGHHSKGIFLGEAG
jgi:hypothetical protein